MNEASDDQDLGTFSQLWLNTHTRTHPHTLPGADTGSALLPKGPDFLEQKPTVLRGRREERNLEERYFPGKSEGRAWAGRWEQMATAAARCGPPAENPRLEGEADASE